jgi:hypothetical protein
VTIKQLNNIFYILVIRETDYTVWYMYILLLLHVDYEIFLHSRYLNIQFWTISWREISLVRILLQIFNHLEGESVSPYNKHINNIIKFLIFVINDPRKENGGNHCSVYKTDYTVWYMYILLLLHVDYEIFLHSRYLNIQFWTISWREISYCTDRRRIYM